MEEQAIAGILTGRYGGYATVKHIHTSHKASALLVPSIILVLVFGSGCSTRLGLGFGFGSGGSSLSLGITTTLPREEASVWTSKGSDLLSGEIQEVKLTFPKNGKAVGSVWGTDLYAEKSSIGMAAVHMGLITFEEGGTVTVQREGRGKRFIGSERNGIESRPLQKTSYGFSFKQQGN